MKLKFVFAIAFALQGTFGADSFDEKKQELTTTLPKHRVFKRGSDIQQEINKDRDFLCGALFDISVTFSVVACLAFIFHECCAHNGSKFYNNFTLP